VSSLSELKQPIIDVLVVIMAIKFLERALAGSALDALFYGAATALVITALVAFTAVSKRSRRSPARDGPRVGG
jgi:uncharacterized membrane protein YqhA